MKVGRKANGRSLVWLFLHLGAVTLPFIGFLLEFLKVVGIFNINDVRRNDNHNPLHLQ